MGFVGVLLALALMQVWGSGGPVQQDGWFGRFHEALGQYVSGSGRQLLAIGVPALVLGLVQVRVAGAVFGLADLVLSVLVLLYATGRGNLAETMTQYLERWSRGDFQAAYEQLDQDSDHPLPEDAVGNPRNLHIWVRRRLYYRSYERLYAVLFWFMLAGPAGALAYRLAALQRGLDREHDAALPILYWLDWLPVRLTAVSFALTGNFDTCYRRWAASVADPLPPVELLERCGNGALGIVDNEGEAVTQEEIIARGAQQLDDIEVLQRRTLIVWVVAIALLTMIF